MKTFSFGYMVKSILKYGKIRRFTTSISNQNKLRSSLKPWERDLGQPSNFTHPHIIKSNEVTPRITKKELEGRRLKLLHKLKTEGNKHLVILSGNELQYMSEDIPYVFHQNTNFLYLTGFLEPNSCLVMEADLNEHKFKSTLLVPKRDVNNELWHGPRSGEDGTTYLTGVNEADNIENLSTLLNNYKSSDHIIWCDYQECVNTKTFSQHLRPFLESVMTEKRPVKSIKKEIHNFRVIKSETELQLLNEACHISGEAIKHSMSTTQAGMNERSLQAIIDCECRLRGASMLAYPPVVAGGNRANTLHYINNNRQLEDGDLVLVDAGCEFNGYCADITRTWPVNGKFTNEQLTIYQIVLNVQMACISICTEGKNMDTVYGIMMHLFAQELEKTDVFLEKPTAKQIYQMMRVYCPHHVGHWLGMDVHDTSLVSRQTPLAPGMVVTVEPGLYFRNDDLNVNEKYRGIGIRIEDDVIIRQGGKTPLVATLNCPKHPQDIEDTINSQK